MSDIWPIENIWSYIKEKLKGEEIQDISILKKNCENFENNYSKNMFQFDKLNTKKGFQITKKDNNDIKKRKILLNVIV